MFTYKNGPEITHLFFIVDHLGHIFSEGDILKFDSKQVIRNFVLKAPPQLTIVCLQNVISSPKTAATCKPTINMIE